MTVRELKKLIEEASNGDVLVIDTIDLSDRGIDMLKKMIVAGRLVPVRDGVESVYKNPNAVMNGDVILAVWKYEVNKD